MEQRPERPSMPPPGPGALVPVADLDTLEHLIAYRFSNRRLLEQALTHSSFAHESRVPASFARTDPVSENALAPVAEAATRVAVRNRYDDNEKLEFLGDAILGFVISDMLFAARPDLREGELSRLKAFIVSAANLVRVAETLRIGEFLRLGRGEEKTGGRVKRALLVDAFEAVLAGVYLDGGLDPVRRIISDAFESQVREIVASGEQVFDFKSVLQERLQAEGRPAARYQLVEETGPSHQRAFTVAVLIDGVASGTGQGPSKKAAEQRAAMEALTRYSSPSPIGFISPQSP